MEATAKSHKLIYLALVLSLIASVLAISCASSAPSTPPSTAAPTAVAPKAAPSTSPTSAPPSAPAPTTAATPVAAAPAQGAAPAAALKPVPQTGGTLRIAYVAEADTLGDPRSTHATSLLNRKPAIEQLARWDDKATLQPWLAEGWQADAAAKTFTVKLKKGIKFHDGSDFNAAAVKFNWELFRAVKRFETERVVSIDVVDDYTVRANLDQWDNSIEYKLLDPAGHMVSPTAWQKNGEEWSKKNPVGTGSFQFVSWERDKGVTYKKWDGYWQKGKPYLDSVRFVMIADPTTAEAAFKNGEVDVLWDPQPLQAKNLQAQSKYVINKTKQEIDRAGWFLVPDVGKPGSPTPWANPKVRQAGEYAINKQAFVDKLLYGYATPMYQYGVPGGPYYNPDIKGRSHNVETAKKLLSEAGYPNGFSTVLMGWDTVQTDLTAFQGMLAEAGIKAEVKTMPKPAMYEFVTKGGWNGLMYTRLQLTGDAAARMPQAFTTTSAEWVAAYRSKEIDDAIQKALTAPDFKTKQALAYELQALVFDKQAVAIPLWATDALSVNYAKVHDAQVSATGLTRWTPEDAWLEK